jgi:HPt (histidine-containing phosphotransfer) domain-containing protein
MTTEKLTQYHTAPSEFVDTVPTPDPGGMIAAYHELTDELATLRADNDARGATIADLRNAIDIANARADRQAARAERAEAELARQKRVTTLMAKVAREMTRGDEPTPKQLDPNVVDWIKQRLS